MLTRLTDATVDLDESAARAGRASVDHAASDPSAAPVAPLPRSGEPTALPVVRIAGVELHAVTEGQCVATSCDSLTEGVGGTS
jgi:hypothetical protein